MDRLSDEDIDRIVDKLAPRLVNQVKSERHEFWIDGEEHYKDHMNMRRMWGLFDTASSIFFRAFVGLVFIGLIVLAVFGFQKSVT